MFKKLALSFSAATLLFTCLAAQAGSFYIGPSLELNNVSSADSNYTGLAPRFSAGYQSLVGSQITMGGEIFGSPGSIDLFNNHSGNNRSIKTTKSYGASFIPGIMINNTTALYARLGVVQTHFTNQNKNVLGRQAGLGLQTSLTPNWDLRSEYIYTGYRSISGVGSPNGNSFALGVIRKFN